MNKYFKDELFMNHRRGRNNGPKLMTAMVLFLLAGLVPTITGVVLGMSRRVSPNARKIVFVNRSGRRVDVFWVNRSTNPVSYVSNSDNGEGFPYGATQPIDSYIGHEFEIREMPSKLTGQCKIPENCQTALVQVNDQEGQKVTIDIDFNVKHEDDRTIAQNQADALLEECDNELHGQEQLDPLDMVDALSDCMVRKVNKTLAKHKEEEDFQAQLRRKMAIELVPYACGDLSFNTSAEFMNRTWYFEDDTKKAKRKYQMQVLHEHVSSSIFQVPDFTTAEECDALRFFVERDTHIPFSTVNDMTKQGRLVLSLATRFYQLTQAAMGWEDLTFQSQSDEFGVNLLEIFKDTVGVNILRQCTQEDLEELNQSDPPACRLPGAAREKVSTRRFLLNDASQVATVFLFCNQDESRQLGGLHFPNAAVHIDSQPNLLVVAQHQSIHKAGLDGYTDEYHFCPNYDVMTHTFHSKNFVDKTKTDQQTDNTPAKDEL